MRKPAQFTTPGWSLLDAKEIELLGFSTLSVKGGKYARAKLSDWHKHTDEIGAIVDDLQKAFPTRAQVVRSLNTTEAIPNCTCWHRWQKSECWHPKGLVSLLTGKRKFREAACNGYPTFQWFARAACG